MRECIRYPGKLAFRLVAIRKLSPSTGHCVQLWFCVFKIVRRAILAVTKKAYKFRFNVDRKM